MEHDDALLMVKRLKKAGMLEGDIVAALKVAYERGRTVALRQIAEHQNECALCSDCNYLDSLLVVRVPPLPPPAPENREIREGARPKR